MNHDSDSIVQYNRVFHLAHLIIKIYHSKDLGYNMVVMVMDFQLYFQVQLVFQ